MESCVHNKRMNLCEVFRRPCREGCPLRKTDEEREYVKTLKGLVSDFVRYSGGGIVDTAYYQHICDWLDGRHIEPKPAEWNTNDKAFIKDCAHILDENGYAASAERLLSMSPVKPAEWSEEDSKRYVSIGTTLETSVVLPKEDYDANMAWLRELVNTKKYSSPKQEWSAEDEKMLARIIERGQIQIPMYETGLLPEHINWLISLPERFNLQPKNEWSEEDKTYLQDALWCVKQAEKSCKDEDDKGACWSAERWLKSLRPRLHWKPSEKHLSALLAVLNDPNNIGSETCHLAITDLYEQLKKLM